MADKQSLPPQSQSAPPAHSPHARLSALALGLATAQALIAIHWFLQKKLGHISQLQTSLLMTALAGMAAGALTSGHWAKRWDMPSRAPRYSLAALALMAMPLLVAGNLALFGPWHGLVESVLSLRQRGTWPTLTIGPLLGVMFSFLPFVCGGFCLPYLAHAAELRETAPGAAGLKIMSSAMAGTVLAFVLQILLPPYHAWHYLSFALGSAIVWSSAVIFLRVHNAAGDENLPLDHARPLAFANVAVLIAAILAAIGSGMLLCVMQRVGWLTMPASGGAWAWQAMAFLLLAWLGIALARRFRRWNELGAAGFFLILGALVLSGIGSYYGQLPYLAGRSLSNAPAASLLLAISFLPLAILLGGSALCIAAFTRSSHLGASSAFALSLALWLIALGVSWWGSSVIGLAYLSRVEPAHYMPLQNLLLTSGAVAALGGALALIQWVRQRGGGFIAAFGAIFAALIALVISAQLQKPWEALRLIDQGRQLHAADKPHVTYYSETIDGSLIVTQDEQRDVTAWIDGKPAASSQSQSAISSTLLGLYPMLLSPQTQRVCAVGMGTGQTIGMLTSLPQIKLANVFESSGANYRAAVFFKEISGQAFSHPAVHVQRQDVLSRFSLGGDHYDLIVWGPLNPALSANFLYYTQDFFRECREHLTERGSIAFAVRATDLSLPSFQRIAAGVIAEFPYVSVFEGDYDNYIFVASTQKQFLSLSTFQKITALPQVLKSLVALDPLKASNLLIGGFITRGDALKPLLAVQPYRMADALKPLGLPRHQDGSGEILKWLMSAQTDPFRTLVQASGTEAALQQSLRKTAVQVIEARALRLRFDSFVQLGRMGEALQTGRSILTLTSGDIRFQHYYQRGLRQLAAKLRSLGDGASAKSLEQTLQLMNPSAKLGSGKPESNPFLEKGRAARDKGDYQEAEKNFRAAFNINPQSEEARYELGRMLLALNRTTESLDILMPLQKNPKLDPGARVTIASALAAAGRNEEAFTQLEMALKEGFADQQLLMRSSYLRALRQMPRFEELMRQYAKPTSRP